MRKKFIWILVVAEFLLAAKLIYTFVICGKKYFFNDGVLSFKPFVYIVASFTIFLVLLYLLSKFVKWFDRHYPPEKDDLTLNKMLSEAGGRMLLCLVGIGFVGCLIYAVIDCSHKHVYDDREGYFEYYE